VNPTEPLPDFLTVEEAAAILRIGRTVGYALTRQWRATDGEAGIPVVSFGRQLRVPRSALEAIAGGPLSSPTNTPSSSADPDDAPPVRHLDDARRSRRVTRPTTAAGQPSLFGEA
jgi:excisionase family DNA binding protein